MRLILAALDRFRHDTYDQPIHRKTISSQEAWVDLFCPLTLPIHASVSCAPTHMGSGRKCRKLKRRVECEYRPLAAKLRSLKYHVWPKYVKAYVHYISHSIEYSFINAIHTNLISWLKAIVTNAPWINIKEHSNENGVNSQGVKLSESMY